MSASSPTSASCPPDFEEKWLKLGLEDDDMKPKIEKGWTEYMKGGMGLQGFVHHVCIQVAGTLLQRKPPEHIRGSTHGALIAFVKDSLRRALPSLSKVEYIPTDQK